MRGALAAASGHRLVRAVCQGREVGQHLSGRSLVLVAAGKAAIPMTSAFTDAYGESIRHALVVSAKRSNTLPTGCEWFAGGHPEPTVGSLAAGRRALEMAQSVRRADALIVLVSGGASAMLAVPAPGLSLDDKRTATRLLLAAGADIQSFNAVRKHLSSIKGGRLAAESAGQTLALIISDVVTDDISVIGSGPTAPDPTTFEQASAIVRQHGVESGMPLAVLDTLARGVRGEISETPKPGTAAMSRVVNLMIGSRRDALEGARQTAVSLGYSTAVMAEPVVGDARTAGASHAFRIAPFVRDLLRPACVLSAGETTVTVKGPGRGGRNQEWALAAAPTLVRLGPRVVAASVGTDGIDGPTDAAGAIADTTTVERGVQRGLEPPDRYLDSNDSYGFFAALGDLVVTGATDTNVGDIQVVVVAE